MSNYQDNHREITIDSFRESFSFLKDIDMSTLVVFDVDSVLIIPEKEELHPFVFQKYKNHVKKLYDHLSKDQRHFLNHIIAGHTSILVDPTCLFFIKKLQNINIPLVALTAAKKGIFNEEKMNFHQVRFNQLFSLGIDFSNNLFTDNDFTNLLDTYGDYPGIRNGIIYSSGLHNKKGDVLTTFLKDKKNIKKIIFFDDKLKHLQSVSYCLKEKFPKIKLLTFHYQGVKKLKLSHDVSQKQFITYLKNLIKKVDNLRWLYS
jgi:hypothetical protein